MGRCQLLITPAGSRVRVRTTSHLRACVPLCVRMCVGMHAHTRVRLHWGVGEHRMGARGWEWQTPAWVWTAR